MSVIQVGGNVELLSVLKVKELAEKISKIMRGEGVEYSRKRLKSVSETSHLSYKKTASQYLVIDKYDLVTLNKSVEEIVECVRESYTVATLRFRATAIRYFACYQLEHYVQAFSHYLETYKPGSNRPFRLYSPEDFYALLELADLYPSDYRYDGWVPIKRRRSKIWSLKRLPENWQEIMAIRAWSEGVKYKLAILVALVTGVRPCELQKGVLLTIKNGQLVALIRGGKVTKDNGQPTRKLVLADHVATTYLIAHMHTQLIKDKFLVRVKSGNAVTKSMTRVGKSLWSKHNSNITVYSARHAMASECKKVDKESGDENPLFTSGTLGHRSDRTKRTYGNIRYGSGGGGGVAPAHVEVPCEIRVHTKSRDFINGKIKCRSQSPSF